MLQHYPIISYGPPAHNRILNPYLLAQILSNALGPPALMLLVIYVRSTYITVRYSVP